MTNLEYIELVKQREEEQEENSFMIISDRKLLRIIAEELCKFNIREENKYSGECCEQSHNHTG